MFNHHFTAYLVVKFIICFFGYVACLVIGQESSTLLIVSLLTAAFIPVVAWMESQQ